MSPATPLGQRRSFQALWLASGAATLDEFYGHFTTWILTTNNYLSLSLFEVARVLLCYDGGPGIDKRRDSLAFDDLDERVYA
jgi:hypothetical protein